jgi:molecular chaperone DnaK
MLAEGEESTLLLDVTPLTLGIASFGDSFSPILEKNTKVPCSVTRTFSTVRDNQDVVKIVAMQGENPRASENVLLGEFSLTGIPAAPRLVPKIDVTFRLDSNGILYVSAKDQATGEAKEISIKGFVEDGKPAGNEVAMKEGVPAPQG